MKTDHLCVTKKPTTSKNYNRKIVIIIIIIIIINLNFILF
jgi:hypothetical protein